MMLGWPVRLILALVFLSVLVSAPPAGAQPGPCPTLDLTDPHQRTAVQDYTCFHIAGPDTAGFFADSPRQLPPDTHWTSAGGSQLVFRNPENAYWILLKVSNSSGHPGLWYLKLSYPQLDEVIFWQEGPETRSTFTTGDHYPFFSRPVDYRYFLLPVQLEPGESASLYLRIRSSG